MSKISNKKKYSLFLSLILVVNNQQKYILGYIEKLTKVLQPLVSNYEIIIIDNGSIDNSIVTLKSLTLVNRLPNLQVFALTKCVDIETASWAGIENSLGDCALIFDPILDDVNMIPTLIKNIHDGADIVFLKNKFRFPQTLPYRISHYVFNSFFQFSVGLNFSDEAPMFRVLNRKLINFISQYPNPAFTYRYLPAIAGFSKINLFYTHKISNVPKRKLLNYLGKGLLYTFITSSKPMRLTSSLSLFCAFANLVYSIYVIGISLFKHNIQPGWASLSLQQSGMFFLISLVLFVLSEYIFQVISLNHQGPTHNISQEFKSSRLEFKEKINIDEFN
jgi:hypothetical protein